MKKNFLKPILFVLLSMAGIGAGAQSLTFNVTTVSPQGSNKPHVFAMWITNASGTYITTINRQTLQRISELTNWKAKATNGTSNTDGMTGATLTQQNQAKNPTGGASRIPFTWNCKDRLGALVPDGTYTINVEFKEENSALQYATYTFVKGTSSTTTVTAVRTSNYITNPSLTYTAPTTAVPQTEAQTNYTVTKTIANDLLVSYDTANGKITAQLLDLKGSICSQKETSTDGTLYLKTAGQKGIYLLKITDAKNKVTIKKVLL